MVKGHEEEVRHVFKRCGTQDCATEWIRLSKSTMLPAMSQNSVMVTTNTTAQIVVKPRHDVTERYRIRAANGVAEVAPNKELSLLMKNFGTKDHRFPEGMVVALASKNPLTWCISVETSERRYHDA